MKKVDWICMKLPAQEITLHNLHKVMTSGENDMFNQKIDKQATYNAYAKFSSCCESCKHKKECLNFMSNEKYLEKLHDAIFKE